MKGLPLGISTFSKLIGSGCVYVDKTRQIHQLVSQAGGYFFLSRPRRFGKSLLISTLKAVFEGNRELFSGLWIQDKLGWKPSPVVRIDFSGLRLTEPLRLERALGGLVSRAAAEHGVKLNERGFDSRFQELIRKLSICAGKAVLLVDEYDKAITDRVDDPEIATANRDVLRDFYSGIKACDESLRFVLITGVSKFSRVSLFSGLNNLEDITVDDRYSTLLGWTEEELLSSFDDWIDSTASRMELPREDLLNRVREWYNGYSWDGRNFVYNPQSILSLFSKGRLSNFWFETGTPSFLLKMMRQYRMDISALEQYETDDSLFEAYDVDRMDVAMLLFQTGYLTIKRTATAASGATEYTLSYPNREVRESLIKHVLADFSQSRTAAVGLTARRMASSIARDDLAESFKLLRSLFASIPYDAFVRDLEGYYETVIYLTLALMGVDVRTEVETNVGRVDAVVETPTRVYVMEFKMGTQEEALEQIREKRYWERFRASGKRIVLVGVSFDRDARNIAGHLVEAIGP
ncbi:MAG: ATP-binding protein [Acidobacteriota bacterium]